MKCAIITPVGPGHEVLAQACQISVREAIHFSTGRFDEVIHFIQNDTKGQLGRSKARNILINQCYEQEIDWLFFLDADDLMIQTAFLEIAEYLHQYDAIWGNIIELQPGNDKPMPRVPQIRTLDSIEQLLMFDPFHTLQIGHFVKTPIAHKVLFDETLDTGEDMAYYLSVWKSYQAVKIRPSFFINRRGMHAIGPHSASGKQWNDTVSDLINDARVKHDIDLTRQVLQKRMTEKSLEVVGYIRGLRVGNHQNYFTLSRQFPVFDSVTVNEPNLPKLELINHNDDLVACSYLWTGHFEPTSLSLWIKLAEQANNIVDIGAYTGLYGLAAASLDSNKTVVCFEPKLENFNRINENIQHNHLTNVTCFPLAIADQVGQQELYSFAQPNFLTSGSSLISNKGPIINSIKVESMTLDLLIDNNQIPIPELIKIDVEGAELAVIIGMNQLLQSHQPDLLIEILDDSNVESISEILVPLGYEFYAIGEETGQMQKLPKLTKGTGLQDLNRFVTCKSEALLQSIVSNKKAKSKAMPLLDKSLQTAE